jgi:cation transport protein ChaC
MDSDLWIFGYGSLIFRVDFPFAERVPATLRHWSRRFWQGSADHRGTEDFPGRVVTLVNTPDIDCWGMAYRIDAADVNGVLDHLDYREKGGYQRLETQLELETGAPITGLTYLAVADNPMYVGEAPLEDMVKQISSAVGPSGPNRDYLLKLEASLKQHGAADDHVFKLAEALRSFESR